MTTEIPWWGVVTAAAAPVLVIGGWTYAARDIPDFDGLRETISALSEPGAPHRTAFTVALTSLGACYLGTAAALRPVGLPGRITLALGGVMTSGVAAFPVKEDAAPGKRHFGLAATAFAALALWPVLGVRREPRILQAGTAVPAAVAMTAELVAFAALLGRPDRYEGLVERLLAGTQATWPLLVVTALRRRT